MLRLPAIGWDDDDRAWCTTDHAVAHRPERGLATTESPRSDHQHVRVLGGVKEGAGRVTTHERALDGADEAALVGVADDELQLTSGLFFEPSRVPDGVREVIGAHVGRGPGMDHLDGRSGRTSLLDGPPERSARRARPVDADDYVLHEISFT
jgi:hypothetical protein